MQHQCQTYQSQSLADQSTKSNRLKVTATLLMSSTGLYSLTQKPTPPRPLKGDYFEDFFNIWKVVSPKQHVVLIHFGI